MIEGYLLSDGDGEPRWKPIVHLDSDQTATKAIAALRLRGEAGLFRIVQVQRIVWAEREGDGLRLHGSHTSSPENLAELVRLFEEEGGRRPVEKARQDRARTKAERAQSQPE